MGPNASTSILTKESLREIIDTEEEKVMRQQRQRLEWCSHRLRNAAPGRGKEWILPQHFLRECRPANTLIFGPVNLHLDFWPSEL